MAALRSVHGEPIAVLPSQSVVVTSGGAPAQGSVVVVNRWSTLDRFTVTAQGFDPTWITIEAAELVLWPGHEETITFVVAAPDGTRAGVTSGRLTVAGTTGRVLASCDLSVEVAAYSELSLEVVPARQQARRDALFRVEVRNDGNADRIVRLFGDDPARLLRFQFDPEEFSVHAGETATFALRAQPRTYSAFAMPTNVVFWIGARTDHDGFSEPAAQFGADLSIRPQYSWVPTAVHVTARVIPALLLLVLLVFLLISRFAPEVVP
jgi:hypothetical protein